MYAVMFTNVDTVDHIRLSVTRTYMSLMMVAPMAVSMMFFMGSMYKKKKVNTAIIIAAVLVFIGCFYGLRNQVFIKDVQYMKAMISHHSSAIMVSQKATIEDPETAELAKQIIESQQREIAQMDEIIRRLEKGN
jgi:uncharacterized protein (DUF305 family)